MPVGDDCRLNRGEPLGPRQGLPRRAAPRGHCRRKWPRLKGEQHHRRAFLALQPGHAVRGVRGMPGILCSARSEEKGLLQTCAGAYCCHSCALRINKCIPESGFGHRSMQHPIFGCCMDLCPVHSLQRLVEKRMREVGHGRAQEK